MSVVQLLSEDMINKIAAGEVVERPASVVKELVENAIDAGATVIRVQALGGGLRLIEVSDNGCGMSREDALLAVERHATSKIRAQDDLERIATLGFRGEALPSIASVSRFTLLTRPAAEVGGTELCIADGKMSCDDAAAPAGTTIRVADLFYNTPARLKFMRSVRTEALQIAETVERLALTAPKISFELLQDDRRQLQTSGSGKLSDVLLAIYGRQVARSWLPVQATQGEMMLQGFIAKPEVAKGTRAHEHWIVNGRYVQSRSLQHGLEEAYRTLLPQKRYPMAVLFLNLPLAQVDVNVHPAKTEVRIQNEGNIHQFVLRGIQQALVQATAQVGEMPANYDYAQMAARGDALYSASVTKQLGLPPSERVKQPSAEHLTWSESFTATERDAEANRRGSTAGEYADVVLTQAKPHGVDSPSAVRLSSVAASAIAMPEDRASIFPPFRVVSQLAGTYILAQCAAGWLIVDQHAAHERILYQKMVADLAGEGVASQLLLQPQTLQLSLQEESLLLEHLDDLQRLGFVLEPFGARTALLRAAPHLLGESSGEEVLREILQQLQQEGKRLELLQLVEKALVTLSCKAAIKANTWLPVGRMEELLQQLGRTDYAATCPHGRPTYRMLMIDELDKWFKRT